MIRIFILFTTLMSLNLMAQPTTELRVEPPFWWIGFQDPGLQLLVYGHEAGLTSASLEYPGVTLRSVERTDNPNYLFINLVISPDTRPGILRIRLSSNGKKQHEIRYELRSRKQNPESHLGFDASDVIYLLMPDRFANGDTTNDNLPGMLELKDRSNPNGRHGGDISGIIRHLDYLKDLGVTTLWINPLLENDQPIYSYHGYACTDYYRIDARFGTNQDYVDLADAIHARGMKLVMDMVFNHCGINHWWMNDLPSPDWINQWPSFTRTSYRATTVSDLYTAPSDSIQFVKGWFDQNMPDLNQLNPFLKNYLIQNSIWWTEYAHLDGIRQDTHPYPFKEMMAEWGKRMQLEYPRFNIVGECWMGFPASVAYWQQDAPNPDGYNSYLPAVFDFPLFDATKVAFTEPEGWNTGIVKLFDLLSQDAVYPDPMSLVTFLDNHDLNRYLKTQGNDVRLMKMALAFLLTTLRIPQLYYGTEWLCTTGSDEGHGMIRQDVAGGWPGDTRNLFSEEGRTPEEQERFDFTRNILQWRLDKEVIHSGKLTHYIPEDGVYVYFRHNYTETVMVVMNNHNEEKAIPTSRYRELMADARAGFEVTSGSPISSLDTLLLPPKTTWVIELRP